MKDNGIKLAELARAARISRQHLLRLRKGSMTPTLGMIVKIANGCGVLLGRTVTPSELFRGLA
jgi:transcriptional regulator with XRE-family HTH domain